MAGRLVEPAFRISGGFRPDAFAWTSHLRIVSSGLGSGGVIVMIGEQVRRAVAGRTVVGGALIREHRRNVDLFPDPERPAHVC